MDRERIARELLEAARDLVGARHREGAVGKYGVFSRFEKTVKRKDILALIKKHYPNIIEDTFRVSSVSHTGGGLDGMAFSNFYVEDADDPELGVTGSVIASVEADRRGDHRVYSYIRIDG
jgi:hypothetical protein